VQKNALSGATDAQRGSDIRCAGTTNQQERWRGENKRACPIRKGEKLRQGVARKEQNRNDDASKSLKTGSRQREGRVSHARRLEKNQNSEREREVARKSSRH